MLCLQTLLCIESVLFQGTRFSTHRVLGVKNLILSQSLQYYHIFHLFISRFEIFFLLISHMLCLNKLSFILKSIWSYVYPCTYIELGVKKEYTHVFHTWSNRFAKMFTLATIFVWYLKLYKHNTWEMDLTDDKNFKTSWGWAVPSSGSAIQLNKIALV